VRESIRISLQPLGREIEVASGARLQDVLFPHGVEFPCGGQGRCRGCRVRVLKGELRETGEAAKPLSGDERADGWRQVCRCQAEGDVTLELAQWEAAILGDDSQFEFHAREGCGIAIDLGTTTLIGQLVDLRNGNVLAVRSGLNPQARHGADIMTRIEFAQTDEGRRKLVTLIRSQLGELVGELVVAAKIESAAVNRVTLVGNTVMHHLFCGFDLRPLAQVPFETPALDQVGYRSTELGWKLGEKCEIRFLPCIGGFVGSDVLGGIIATGMADSEELIALVDLGTNGEIVVGNRDGILCASTAAGPAFEGARISMGMRAATGAISRVESRDGRLHCHVLGDGRPRGICGSGLVDAVAAGLKLDLIRPNGRLPAGADLSLVGDVRLTQGDLRELQLAKGAIAAGLRILQQRRGGELARVDVAGAFGNYLNLESARRIGLIDHPPEFVHPVGNTALRGAKMALFEDETDAWESVRRKIEHVGLGSDPEFMDVYVGEMNFLK